MSLGASCWVLFGIFSPYIAYVHSLHISNYFTIVFASAPSSYFSLAVFMREVSCAGYTARALDPRSL